MIEVLELEATILNLNLKLNEAKTNLLKVLMNKSPFKVGDRIIEQCGRNSIPVFVITRGELDFGWGGWSKVVFYGKKVLKDGHSLHSVETRLYGPKKCNPDQPENGAAMGIRQARTEPPNLCRK